MDRSRRAMNPDNYNPDGTNKKGRLKWVESHAYKKDKAKVKEIYRKECAVRKQAHNVLANKLISMGSIFYVEDMNFKSLQEKASTTEIDEETGLYKSKKRFGKSLANRAPSEFLAIMNKKLSRFEIQLIEINTKEAKASQYNHVDDTYTKKDLNERWNNIGDIPIQRDLYSAYLIMNINPDLSSFDRNACIDNFNNFVKLHDETINQLRIRSLNHHYPSCMGIG